MNKLIINGFFRSGTSAVWENLKKSNLDAVVFYEPCHPQLIKLSSQKCMVDELHNMNLWQEYSSLQKELLSHHPYISQPAYGVRLTSYINVFERFALKNNKNLILQSNRWHFELLNFIENDYQVIHVVRPPREVFVSMKKVYFKNNKNFFSNKIAEWFNDFWEFTFMMKFLSGIHSGKYLNMSRLKANLTMSLEEKFVLIWTLVNLNAIRNIKNETNGYIVSYRELGNDDLAVNVFEKTGFQWNKSYFRPSKLDTKEIIYYKKTASKLEVLEEYEEVIRYL